MKKLTVENKERIREAINVYLQSNREARYVHRLHAILLLMDGRNNCAGVGRLFNESPRSLANWVHKINQTGDIGALREKRKTGRKPRLTAQEIEGVAKAVRQPPEKAGVNAKKWNGEALSHYIEQEFGVALKVRQCQRLIRDIGGGGQK